MAAKPTWGITATVDEPLPLLAAFVAHHLALGASQIFLYLDAVAPDVEAFFAAEPMVVLVRTDAAYWASKGETPQVHVRRQLFNGIDAYARAEVDWLLHCDGDEFLCASGGFADELAGLGPDVLSLRVLNSERVWLEGAPRPHIFAGMARHPLREGLERSIDLFGDADRFLRQGVLGYPNGKRLARTGQGLFMGIHDTKRMGPDGWADHTSTVETRLSQTAGLVHFDGLTPLHWQVKLLRKVRDARTPEILRKRVGSPRFAQIEAVRAQSGDPQAISALHDALRVLPEGLAGRMRDAGLLEPLPVDPAAAIADRYEEVDWDLSDAGFDAWLAARLPDLVAALRG